MALIQSDWSPLKQRTSRYKRDTKVVCTQRSDRERAGQEGKPRGRGCMGTSAGDLLAESWGRHSDPLPQWGLVSGSPWDVAWKAVSPSWLLLSLCAS